MSFLHSKRLVSLGKRWGLKATSRAGFLLNTVIPTAQVDRGWGEDEIGVWGYTTDEAVLAATPFPTTVIFAGATSGVQDRDCYVRKIELNVSKGNSGPIFVPIDATVHIARLLTGYDPFDATPAGEFFPAIWPNRGGTIQIPSARVLSGAASALPQVVINGVPVIPFLGPRYNSTFASEATAFAIGNWTTVLDWNDPPLFVPRNEALLIQVTNPQGAPGGARLWTNIWLTERLPDRQ